MWLLAICEGLQAVLVRELLVRGRQLPRERDWCSTVGQRSRGSGFDSHV